MSDELVGEIGRIQGVVFVDEHGNPLPSYDQSKCPECGLTRADGTWWDAHQFWAYYEIGGGMMRWRCLCGHTWVTSY